MLEVRSVVTRGIPLHPHSGSLQIWLETGAVGAALGALALVIGGVAMSRALAHRRAAAGAACATLVSFGFIANVSYGIWQEWWVATALIAAAAVSALACEPAAGSTVKRI